MASPAAVLAPPSPANLTATTSYTLTDGSPLPLGSTPDATGVNFSVFSQHANRVQLLLFENATDTQPVQTFDLTAKTGFYWHGRVEGFKAGKFYAYRVDGPDTLEDTVRFGHRYNPNKVLLDPYATGNVDNLYVEAEACHEGDNVATAMRSVVIATSDYDWEGDQPLNLSRKDTVIYELHVKGFTASPTSGSENPGTFLGIMDKIPYLQQLGITAVELLPIFDFDAKTVRRINPETGEALHNYWGYDPFGFFAPQSSYCVSPDEATHLNEFRDMVKALHKAGIEVILDVVFNHTGEGDGSGPTISLKGMDNSVYYYLNDHDKRQYRGEYTGLGNSVNCNHPAVSKLFSDCLHFWVNEMHVDGFRFDLGAILAVGDQGQRLKYPPIVWAIDLDSSLANTKVIVEPYGANTDVLGSFPQCRSATWNWKYKNTIRNFVRGDRGIIGEVATRISGSSDLFADQDNGYNPLKLVSYITCHDGFTMNDLVSYNQKHNQANAEDSGDDNNHSWNCGVEGPSTDPTIENFRVRQVKNCFTILFLSQGIPMMMAGDEFRRTQQGNNNAYAQDNALSWVDWSLAQRNQGLLNFVKGLIAFRKRFSALRRSEFFTGESVVEGGLPDISWHGCNLYDPGWQNTQSGCLAFTLANSEGLPNGDLHVMMNMEDSTLMFELPPQRSWFRVIDTNLGDPDSLLSPGSEPAITGTHYSVSGHSVVVLVSR